MPRGWFGSKRIGWGLRPVSWQGWVLTALYVLLLTGLALGLATRHTSLFLVVVIVLTAASVAVAALTRE